MTVNLNLDEEELYSTQTPLETMPVMLGTIILEVRGSQESVFFFQLYM